MRAFPEEEERRFRDLDTVRDWARSGWLTPAEAGSAESALGKPWMHGGAAVRLLLGGLSLLAQAGAVGFLCMNSSEPTVRLILLAAAAAAWAGAEAAIAAFRLHRFGAEEGLVAGAVLWFLMGLGSSLSLLGLSPQLSAEVISLAAAAVSAAVFARFGYAAAGLGVLAGLASAVIASEPGRVETRVFLAAMFSVLWALSLPWQGPAYSVRTRQFLRACAFLGVYLSLHLFPGFGFGDPWPRPFYWATYAAVWTLPFVGLAVGVRLRDRAMLGAGIAALLVTMATNKPYLGWERNAWDPILLGAFLMAAAASLTRWLDGGEAGRRGAFTARPLVRPKSEGLEAGAVVAAAVAGAAAGSAAAPQPERRFEGGGGSAGGAGASGGF